MIPTLVLACALVTAQKSEKIVMGEPGEAKQVPYLVRVHVDGAMCGGGLISKRAVLTAAHCTTTTNPAKYDIHEGRNTQAEMDVATRLAVVAVHPHEGYTDQPFQADIAVIRVDPNHPLTVFLAVDTESIAVAGTPLHLEGWGLTELNGTASSLNRLEHTVVEASECQSGPYNATSFFCAAADRAGSTACMGDSGSPLVSGTTVVGLVSHGDKECKVTGTSFTRVASYAPWILTLA